MQARAPALCFYAAATFMLIAVSIVHWVTTIVAIALNVIGFMAAPLGLRIGTVWNKAVGLWTASSIKV